jgi:hypothetical protein
MSRGVIQATNCHDMCQERICARILRTVEAREINRQRAVGALLGYLAVKATVGT